jgi:RNA polymerase sigma-70 factor, ECF subfamily
VAGCVSCEGSPSLPPVPPGRRDEPGAPLGPDGREETGLVRETNASPETVARLHLVSSEAYPNWDAIYLDNVQRLYRLMYSRVGNRPDAEDLTSEVFMAALGPLRSTASKPEVRAYLIATARTVLAGYWRSRLGIEVTAIDVEAAVQFMDDAPPPPADDPDDRAGRVLGLLPDRYRRILELRFLQSMSLKEVAAEMRITVGNAKVLQHRALVRAAEAGKDVVP